MSVAGGMIRAIRWYQRVISANRPACCRYYPTCSHYAIEALQRYGAFRGGVCLPHCACCAADLGAVAALTMFRNAIPCFTDFPGRRRMKSLD